MIKEDSRVGPHEPRQSQWHVNREISLGDILAIAVAIASVITAYMSLNARVMVVEALSAQTSQQLSGTVAEIKSDLKQLNSRLERIIESKVFTK